jgi:hypothetical protein
MKREEDMREVAWPHLLALSRELSEMRIKLTLDPECRSVLLR